MATQIYVKLDNLTNPTQSMECVEFSFGDAWANYQSQYAQASFTFLKPSLSTPYLGIRCDGKISFAKDGERYKLIDYDNLTTPFVDSLKLGVNIKKPESGEPWTGGVVWTDMTQIIATSENQPDDWTQNYWRNYYYKDGTKLYPVTGSAWIDGREYYRVNLSKATCARKFYCDDGLYTFGFTVFTRLGVDSQGYQSIYSGMVTNPVTREYGQITDYPYTFKAIGSASPLVPNTLPGYSQYTWVWGSSATAGSQSIFAQSYPVHFVIPAGTYRNKTADGTTYGDSFTVDKNTPMFGIVTIYFDGATGLATSYGITAMQDTVWKSPKHREQDFGDDTKPGGGEGPQRIGKDNPMKDLTIATGSGGALTNPLSGPGLVIYKMTSSEFNTFMERVYSEAALPNWFLATDQKEGDQGLFDFVAGFAKINLGLTNTENIVFVKTSPISFPTVDYNLSRVSIGVMGISHGGGGHYNMHVVTDVTKTETYDVGYDNAANSFTDVEPYKSATIYFPLAGEVQLMPSYLEHATIHIRAGYNLLNDGAAYSCAIKGDNGYIRLSKSGQCAKHADYIITKNYMGEAIGKLIPTVAIGAATIATGGTTAPALATTAVGAATGFVENATNMNVVNVPNSAAGSPYDECVYGGLRDIMLTSVKAERFASGETYVSGSLASERAMVQGYYSYYYVKSIANIQPGNFASFCEVDLSMGNGMTKAEYDKIMAYLQEGVYR